MSATQIFGAVRAAAPAANPFLAIAATLQKRLYPPMPSFFNISINVLHGLYALQTVILLVALGIRWKRSPNDMWLFKSTTTARGNYITPHFAVAWQSSSLLFLLLLQPYLVMTKRHTVGSEWRGYLGWRSIAYLPAWVSVWLALWSLAVAVCLPRATGRRRHHRFTFFTSPAFLNCHFICGVVLCATSVIVPSAICALHYDQAISHFSRAKTALLALAPAHPSLSSAEIDSALLQIAPEVDSMLMELARFPYTFTIAWSMWLGWIVYAYTVFVIVALVYFGYIQRSLKRVAGLDTRDSERQGLKKAWRFAAATSVLVTGTGVVYASASLAAAAWTKELLASPTLLTAITMLSLYGFGILGLAASALSLAQSLVGSSSSSLIHSPSTDVTSRSAKLNGTRVQVTVTTRTQVESEKDVVQLELADWQRAAEEKEGFVDHRL